MILTFPLIAHWFKSKHYRDTTIACIYEVHCIIEQFPIQNGITCNDKAYPLIALESRTTEKAEPHRERLRFCSLFN